MDRPFDLPLRLAPNRVYRFYRGGALMDAFRGAPEAEDTDHPEDWVGSVTPALNPREHGRPGEGLSMVEVDGSSTRLADLLAAAPERVAGREVVARYGATTALLVKLLDAGWRLPVHGHPTREFARRVLGSPFGKAEAWVVLATRQMPGQPSPRVWLGFREDVERDELEGLIERQDGDALRAAMNEIPVQPGDAVFVRPGLLHATGAGVFLIEAQEPTDYSVVAEYRGYPIDPDKAHLGRGWDTMLDCFDRRRDRQRRSRGALPGHRCAWPVTGPLAGTRTISSARRAIPSSACTGSSCTARRRGPTRAPTPSSS